MKPHEVREAILAGGKVTNLEGLEDGTHQRLVQFQGSMGCGWEYSVRATNRGVFFEVRSPETHKHQGYRHRSEQFAVSTRTDADQFGHISRAVVAWLDELDAEIRQMPSPVLLTAEEFAELKAAERHMFDTMDRAQDALFTRMANSNAENDRVRAETKQTYDAATEAWKAVYMRVYTWDNVRLD